MAWASRSGRARVSSSNPQAFGVCQRCGIWFNRVELRNQMAWKGATLLPTWLFVCARCYDTPNEQDRAFIPPADPVPIQLPLPEDFEAASDDVMGLTVGATTDPRTGIPIPGVTAMQTVDGVTMGPTPIGRPPGYYDLSVGRSPAPNAVLMAKVDGTYMTRSDEVALAMQIPGGPASGTVAPLAEADGLGQPLPVLSLIADGTPLVRATCSGPHGLALNAQVAVRGSLNPLADGVFSVIPITATVFTYGCYSPIKAGSIIGSATIIAPTQIGLPRQYEALPQTGRPQSIPTE